MTSLVVSVAWMAIAVIVLIKSIEIAGESERFAVFSLGRFHAFAGPGLVLIIPFTQQAHRLKVGDIGVVTGSKFARFGAFDIPISNAGSWQPNQSVRIDGFDGVEPRLVASSLPDTTVCPSCGHSF